MSNPRRTYDEFVFKSLISEGSFGKVYLCRDKKFDIDVAIKVVKSQGNQKELKNVKFLYEISIPCVVKFYGYFTKGLDLYIIMEYCQHGDLRKVINDHKKSGTRIDDDSIKQWSRELILVMIFMQDNNIIHNDIKPENILVNQERNSILLADVGEAQFISKAIGTKNTTASWRGGTLDYMAPERKLLNGEILSTASDIWSCGIVFYELIYLKYPFQYMKQLMTPQVIHHDKTGIGAFFKPVFDGIFVLDPEERFSPGKVRLLIMSDSSTNGKGESEPAKILKQPQGSNMRRISDSWPKLETEHYMEIMDPIIIDNAFKMNSLVALVGVGGAGKTTLALEYARKFSRKDESVVVWFYADSMSKMQEKIQSILINDLAFNKKIVSSMNEETRVEKITKHVKKHRGPHLFVFDNIEEDEMQLIEHFSNGISGNFKILLVTQNSEIGKRFKVSLNMLVMAFVSAVQAKQYLVDRVSSRLSAGNVEKIFNQVFKPMKKHNPYYLMIVVTELLMLLDNYTDLNQLEALIQQLKSFDISEYVLGFPMNDYSCKQILERVEFLDSDEISLDVLSLLIKPKEQVIQGVGILSKYCIVEKFSMKNKEYIKFNHFMLTSIKNSKRFSGEKKSTIEIEIIEAFLNELEKIATVNQKNIQKVENLQNHIAKLLEKKNYAFETTLKLYEKLIQIEETYNFNFVKAAILRRKMMEMIKASNNQQSDIAKIASSLEKLGIACSNSGNYSDAIKLHNEALEKRKRIHEDKSRHLNVANSLSNLGNVYKDIGYYSKAFELHKEVLEMRQTHYKEQPDHPDVARSLNDMGLVHYHLGDYSMAMRLHQEALEMRKNFYGDQKDHLDIAESFNNLGLVFESTGDYHDSVEFLQQALEMRRRIYKSQPDHPDIATSLNNLGSVHANARQNTEAIERHLEALNMRRKVYKNQPDHQAIAESLGNLGIAFHKTRIYSKSTQLLKEALDMSQARCKSDSFSQDNPATLDDLGMISTCLGNNLTAKRFYEDALKIYQRVHRDQPNHPNVARTLSNLGITYASLGNHMKSIKLYEEALKIWRKVFVNLPEHPKIVENQSNLAVAYAETGQHLKSIQLNQEVLDKRQRIHKTQPNHPDIAASLSNLGNTYQNVGNYSKAIKLYEKSLQIRQLIYKDQSNHPDFANSLNDLGTLYKDTGNYTKALDFLKQALEMRRIVYQDQLDHPDIAASLSNLGFVYASKCNYSEALQYHDEALKMRQRIYKDQPDHPLLASSLEMLRDIQKRMKKRYPGMHHFHLL